MAMKKCPFCAEEIQDEAIKCRYCGSSLEKQLEKKIDILDYTQSKLLPRDFLVSGEQIYLETRPLFWSKYFGVIILFIISCFWPPLFIFTLIVLFIRILQWKKTVYAITNKRVIKLKGPNCTECPLGKIQNVEMKILGKAVKFDTAGTTFQGIEWNWLKNPKEVYKKVTTLLHEATI